MGDPDAGLLDDEPEHDALAPAPPGTRVRRPTDDDAAAVRALHERTAATGGDDRPDTASLRSDDEMLARWEERRGDALVVELDGRLVAYADFLEALDPWTPSLDLVVEGRVDAAARGRGVGTFLVARAVDRARRAAAGAPHLPTELRTSVVDPAPDTLAWFGRHGFAPVRHVLQLRLDLTGTLPAPAWPAGTGPRAWQAAAPRSVHRALRAAFADHHLGVTDDYDTWRVVALASRRVQPPACVLAVDDAGAVVGVALGRVGDADDPAQATVTDLGVVPAWRGRGLATALLRSALRRYRDLGAVRVGLEVDDVTLDGALRLYERAGMEVVHHAVVLARPVTA